MVTASSLTTRPRTRGVDLFGRPDERGVLVVSDGDVRKGERLPDVRLVDVAPTLMAAARLTVTTAFDGRALDIFTPAREAAYG